MKTWTVPLLCSKQMAQAAYGSTLVQSIQWTIMLRFGYKSYVTDPTHFCTFGVFCQSSSNSRRDDHSNRNWIGFLASSSKCDRQTCLQHPYDSTSSTCTVSSTRACLRFYSTRESSKHQRDRGVHSHLMCSVCFGLTRGLCSGK
jgi:hypothetical protein